ncbi:MAG: SH3 domain-containing protein [Nitrospiria bacterium]
MIELIEVVLAVFGVCAFFFAFGGTTIGDTSLLFGGERWSDDDTALFRRITGRGWLSLICFLVAVGLAVGRVRMMEKMERDDLTSKAKLEEENTVLRERISKHVTNIVDLKKETQRARGDLSGLSSQIETHHLLALESAFKLSSKPIREKDETVVHLDGRALIPLTSRYQDQMHLVGGDQFYFSTFIQNLREIDLRSVQLEVGDKQYALFDRPVDGFFERTLRLPGNPVVPMPALLHNPLLINNVTLKIFVHPRDRSRGHEVFKALVLGSPFSELAKETYKMTTADILNVRLNPGPNAPIVSRLPRGSFVRKLSEQGSWIEVMTPEDKQGWITKRFIAEIEPSL